jgi:S1-C subfamily serine protease
MERPEPLMPTRTPKSTLVRQFMLVFAMTVLAMTLLLYTDLLSRISYTIEKGRIRAWREQLPGQAQLDNTFHSARAVAEVVAPAVVNVETQSLVTAAATHRPNLFRDLRRYLSNPDKPDQTDTSDTHADDGEEPSVQDDERFLQRGVGSGFVFDAAHGYVLTNAHVIDGADRINVGLADGRVRAARVVGRDLDTDLAVLAIPPEGLHELSFGDAHSAQVGDDVFAVGNPFGLDGSFSRGIISAKGRSNINIHGIQYRSFLQTDAVINPGNSGGPLVNMRGEVIGINTAIATQSGHYDGVGFAIPSWRISQLLPQLLAGGQVIRGYLGVEMQPLAEAGKPVPEFNGQPVTGVRVKSVRPESPAERAGIQPGDVLLSFNHAPISSADDLIESVSAIQPGTEVPIDLLRGGVRLTFSVEIGRQPPGFQPRPTRN